MRGIALPVLFHNNLPKLNNISFFADVIVIVQECQKFEIQQALEKTPLKLKLDFATIPSDSDFGTADSLKHIQDK